MQQLGFIQMRHRGTGEHRFYPMLVCEVEGAFMMRTKTEYITMLLGYSYSPWFVVSSVVLWVFFNLASL